MPWTVRYRVRVSKPLTSDATELTLVIGGREALVSGEGNKPLKESNWLTLNIHGLENEDAAREFGRRVALALLLAGARQDVGIDAGENRATSGFGKIVADEVAEQGGKLLPNVHGLFIYEREGNEVFFHLSANARVTTDPSMYHPLMRPLAWESVSKRRLPSLPCRKSPARYVSRRWNTFQPMRHY